MTSPANMTFLELVQRLAREVGASNEPDTVVDQDGEALRLVQWTQQAWQEIQTKHDDWTWMRSSNLIGAGVSFTTIAGDYDYPLGTGAGTVGVAAADFGSWDRDSFRLYTTAYGINDEQEIAWIDYDAWRNGYMLGAQRSVRTRPIVMSIGPGETVVVAPPPTAGYTITADYFVAPTVMEADDDVPVGLPIPYQLMIVWLAMTYYAGYESAPDVLAKAQGLYAPMMRRLERIRAQEITTGGALA